jgi:hypothetical protein
VSRLPKSPRGCGRHTGGIGQLRTDSPSQRRMSASRSGGSKQIHTTLSAPPPHRPAAPIVNRTNSQYASTAASAPIPAASRVLTRPASGNFKKTTSNGRPFIICVPWNRKSKNSETNHCRVAGKSLKFPRRWWRHECFVFVLTIDFSSTVHGTPTSPPSG